MNASELVGRLCILEQKVEKLSPSMNISTPANGTNVPGVSNALGVRLIGITTAQRVALGVTLAAFPEVQHILVYDTEDQTFYIWSGSEWV